MPYLTNVFGVKRRVPFIVYAEDRELKRLLKTGYSTSSFIAKMLSDHACMSGWHGKQVIENIAEIRSRMRYQQRYVVFINRNKRFCKSVDWV